MSNINKNIAEVLRAPRKKRSWFGWLRYRISYYVVGVVKNVFSVCYAAIVSLAYMALFFIVFITAILALVKLIP